VPPGVHVTLGGMDVLEQDRVTRGVLDAYGHDTCDVSVAEDACSWLRSVRDARGRTDRAAGAELRRLLGRGITGTRDAGVVQRLGDLLRGQLIVDAHDDFDAYMQAMEFDRPPEQRFWLPRRRQLMPLCQGIQRLEDDPNERMLIVSCPPRVGKSTTCIMGLNWHMGRHPLDANLMTGHSDKLTKGFYGESKSMMTEERYNYHEIFPESPYVWDSSEDEAIALRARRRFPTLTCRSIEGTLTGAVEVGEHGWLYADDLVEDLEEAMSPARLDRKWGAFVNQAYDRRKDGTKILMVGTRWDVADPEGRMLDMHRGEPGYRELVIPALDPSTGESNFEYQYGLGFSTSYYIDMKRMTDDATWCAKYEGAPYVRQGQLFPPDQLRRFLSMPSDPPDAVVAVADTKDRGIDFCVMPVAYVYGQDWYIGDVVCDDAAPELVRERLVQCLMRNGVQQARFESNSAGGATAREVSNMLVAREGQTAITTKYTSSNKETRILAASPWIMEHCLFLDESEVKPGSDYSRFLSQLTSYALQGKNRHDDAPDALSMLSEFASRKRKAKVQAVRRPF